MLSLSYEVLRGIEIHLDVIYIIFGPRPQKLE